LIARIRAGVPGIALRTTFIVGFPGETAAAFSTLLEFIRQTRFERLGVFLYSPQEGTRAARMCGEVSDSVKRRRRDQAMAVQQQVARQLGALAIGRTLRVLVEREAAPQELGEATVHSWEHGFIRSAAVAGSELRGRWMVARGPADAPDIDGRVYVRGRLPAGDFTEVRIVGHTDYDLLAEPLPSRRSAAGRTASLDPSVG
jgi:ribosomal protein S12 methylthiotransferase